MISNVSWILAGIKPNNDDEEFSEKEIQEMANEAFEDNRHFSAIVCGLKLEHSGTLEQMEESYNELRKEEFFEEGDFGISSLHERAELLFLPTQIENETDA